MVRVMVQAAIATVLVLGGSAAVSAQTALDVERGRLVQRITDLHAQMREAYARGEHERVLDLCNQLESLEPSDGRVQFYRSRALEAIQSGGSPLPAEVPAPGRPSALAPDVTPVVTPVAPAPVNPTEPMDVAVPELSPTPATLPLPEAAPAAEEPRLRRSRIDLPLVGRVERVIVYAAGGGLAALVAAVVVLVRLRRRTRSVARPSEPITIGEPRTWVPSTENPVESSVLDDAFAQAATEPIAAPAPLETTPGQEALLATLAAPWGSIEEAVEAIRQQIHAPPAPKPEPAPAVAEVTPVSIEGLGTTANYDLLQAGLTAKSQRAAVEEDPLEFTSKPAAGKVDSMSVDELFAPGGSRPVAPRPLDLGLDDVAPAAEAPPMTTDDLLAAPSTVPRPRPEEMTAPPLSLDDLLGPPPPGSAPEKNEAPSAGAAVFDDLDIPAPKPAGVESPNVFRPEDLEETIQLPRPAPPKPRDSITLVLPPAEIQEALSEVAPKAPPEPEPVTAAPAAMSAVDDSVFMESYRRGLLAVKESNWAAAIEHLERAHGRRPESADVLRLLRQAQEALRRRESTPAGGFTPGL